MDMHYAGDKADQKSVTNLLLGRKVTKVSKDTVRLDNGMVLRFQGHEGGCSCGAGDYDLTELNGIDNVITNVEFVDRPEGDEHYYENGDEDTGYYRIFVYAGNEMVNLATFEGSDGNGWYGTGYYIYINPEVEEDV